MARLTLERVGPVAVETFGEVHREPPLSIIAGVGADLDTIRARAALVFSEPRGRAVELVYHVADSRLAVAARAAVAHAEAVYGIAHRLVILPAKATAADRVFAALDAASAPRMLVLGADVLPVGTGWLAPWLTGLGEGRPILGGTLLDAAGSVVDAGGSVAGDGDLPVARRRALGWPARELARATTATDLVTAECVGITRSVADLLSDATPHYPNPDVMLASVVQAVRRQGQEARTLTQSRFVRYAVSTVRNPIIEAADARALGLVLKPFFRSGSDQLRP
jgi:hypothetical protein